MTTLLSIRTSKNLGRVEVPVIGHPLTSVVSFRLPNHPYSRHDQVIVVDSGTLPGFGLDTDLKTPTIV